VKKLHPRKEFQILPPLTQTLKAMSTFLCLKEVNPEHNSAIPLEPKREGRNQVKGVSHIPPEPKRKGRGQNKDNSTTDMWTEILYS